MGKEPTNGQILRCLLALLMLVAWAPAHAAASGGDTVTIDSGTIKGLVLASHRAFDGIPFAAPPVGALRFKAPQPVQPWTGVRNTQWPGYACPQQPDADLHLWGSDHEDCLYLNVITPNPMPAKPVPVMVWFYGGGFVTGSAADYLPVNLVSRGGVIVVTLNYRLGPFGFLAHPALAAESQNDVGNYGLLDQQAGLNWVHRNIAAFGGDPDNVTIFGESAGGASVCANIASPAVRGLFHKAIIESGPCALPLTVDIGDAETYGEQLAADNHCPTTADAAAAACLRALPVSTLLAAEGSIANLTGSVPFYPVSGTPLMPKAPSEAISAGQFNRVPVLQGSNHDEARLIAALSFDLLAGPLTADQYPQQIQSMFGDHAATVLQQYPLSDYASPDLAWAAVVTDDQFSCNALRTDEALVSQHIPVYAYEFDDPTAPPFINMTEVSIPLGAYHGSEVGYLFINPLELLNSTQRSLAHQMIAYWTRFAATGNPNVFGQPYWPRFDAGSGKLLSLVPKHSQVTTSFAADHQCDFWKGIDGGLF